jgi:6-hydroxycyclohex-1-ene-1-carbonyl-CoA dehydrogenase
MMTAPSAVLEHHPRPAELPGPGEAMIEVAGCGVCHTDLSFLHDGVRTRSALPLVLGHEISGYVREVGPGVDAALVGRAVVVPAVLPCGECDLCRAGRRSICRKQVMPGNDRHGGFASHVVLPARFICPVSDAILRTHDLWELSVVADAVSTPFQAVKRSGLGRGDVALCVGVGGIGLYGVQIAAAAGAHVVALDIDDAKLAQAKVAGARATLNVKGVAIADARKQVKRLVDDMGGSPFLWKIFETSGTRTGQELAYSLIGHGATLSVVGYATGKIEICLSNLMAFDAIAQGNWGADPLLYPEIMEWIEAGRIAVRPYVERHALGEINEVFELAHHGKLFKRAVLVPD